MQQFTSQVSKVNSQIPSNNPENLIKNSSTLKDSIHQPNSNKNSNNKLTNFSSEKRYDKKTKNKDNPRFHKLSDGNNISPRTNNINPSKRQSNNNFSFQHNNVQEEYFWDLDKGTINEEEFYENIVNYDY